ncbi:glutamyl-tRNA synthetase [Cecembia rubra]|uniref:Glutamyl-tRNA synthetase n=2 Tax=Cecembia rubra TaxID=1485585 RepID=A0A2P8EDU4_9BACT|nr:glutamyl-tRNA synthetase [Cecembia rubra]
MLKPFIELINFPMKFMSISSYNPIYSLTRFAPTPSGYLHLGNIFSFLTTFKIAKTHHAKILLRIDDMDRERVRKEYIQDIFDTLDFLEIPYDLGPKNLKHFESEYAQKNRMELYLDALETLKKTGKLFACNCSRKKILDLNPNGYYSGYCRDRFLGFNKKNIAWRFCVDARESISFMDIEAGITEGNLPEILADFIVRRKDGLPAYQLSSVVDDLYFGVDLIVRGKDLLGSTMTQVHLSKFLSNNSFGQIGFFHHSLIRKADGQKLSKSAGDTSVQFLRKSGKKKEDIFEMIGKRMGQDTPIRGLQDFILLS